MSKIEVLRVPETSFCCPGCTPATIECGSIDGSVLLSVGLTQVRIPASRKPALLAALLEDAGWEQREAEFDMARGIITCDLQYPEGVCTPQSMVGVHVYVPDFVNPDPVPEGE